MVVHQCPDESTKQGNGEPECLALDEKIDIAVAFLRKGAGAEKHDDAESGQRNNGEQKGVDSVPLHLRKGTSRAARPHRPSPTHQFFRGGIFSF